MCISTGPVERPRSKPIRGREDASVNLCPIEALSLIHSEVFCLRLFRKALLLVLPYAKAELNHNPGKTAEKFLTECCSGYSPDVP